MLRHFFENHATVLLFRTRCWLLLQELRVKIGGASRYDVVSQVFVCTKFKVCVDSIPHLCIVARKMPTPIILLAS